MRLVGLEHVAAAQRAEDTEDREQDRENLAPRDAAFGKPLGQVIHRTARDVTVLELVAIFHTQRTFGEFRRHAQKTRQDHPEGGARATNAHGHRHAGDVTQAHRARKRRGKRLEVADLTGIVGVGIVALDQRDRMPERPELHEPEIEGEDRCGDNQPHHDPRKIGAGEGAEDEADEPAGRIGKDLVDGFVKPGPGRG